MARHPSRQQLASWLNGEHNHLDDHIENCPKCASRLDELDASASSNVHPLTEELRPALLAVLQPPEDLHERVNKRIAERLQDRDDANLLGSLLSVPAETGRVFFDRKR